MITTAVRGIQSARVKELQMMAGVFVFIYLCVSSPALYLSLVVSDSIYLVSARKSSCATPSPTKYVFIQQHSYQLDYLP